MDSIKAISLLVYSFGIYILFNSSNFISSLNSPIVSCFCTIIGCVGIVVLD